MAENSQGKEKCCSEGKVWKDGRCVLPEVTFTALVMSLSTSGLVHLGELDDPSTGQKNKDPVLIKHTIDTLDMLQCKTKGNLTDEEAKMLHEAIYDLKMRYVRVFG